MERELWAVVGMIGFYAMLIIGVGTLATKSRGVFAREQRKIGVFESYRSLRESPPIDVLRVGEGAIVTVRSDIGEEPAGRAREIVRDMIEEGVLRMILEVDGPAEVTAPLLGLLSEVAETSAVARVHLSLVTSDGAGAAILRGSALEAHIPVFHTHGHAAARD
jgi:hypothetical protein